MCSHTTLATSKASAVIGFVGGGQLARMIHQAAIGLGIEVVVLTSDPDDDAVAAGARRRRGALDDVGALLALARSCDVITVDHGVVSGHHLQALVDAGHTVRPGPAALALTEDKAFARHHLAAAGFPVPAHVVVGAGDAAAVARFAQDHGWPIVCKRPTVRQAGGGVAIAGSVDDLPPAPNEPGSPDRWLVEERVPLATELVVLVARRPSGWLATYPLIEKIPGDGICRDLVMPAVVAPDLEERAVSLAVAIADGIDAVGILAVELFVADDGRLLVNEVATRPHGHGPATLDGAATAPFENHLRAVLDWPLGDTSLRGRAAATVDLLGGHEPPDPTRVPHALADPSVHVHLSGQAWRPGRRLGQVTAVGDTTDEALASARAGAAALMGP